VLLLDELATPVRIFSTSNWFVAYLEPEVEDLDALADAASGVPELAAAQSG
jgi:hypothetical protein